MNKEKTLDILAVVILFICKFIITPILAVVFIISLWSIGLQTYERHIPLKEWAVAFSIVATMFGTIYLLSWAICRRENKS
jgi:hypothetical protein